MLLERWGKLLYKSIIASSAGSTLLEDNSIPKHCITASPKTSWGTQGTYSVLKMTLDTYIWGMQSHLKFKYSQRTQRAGVSSSNTDVSCNFSHYGLSRQCRRVQHSCKYPQTSLIPTNISNDTIVFVAFSKWNSSCWMDTIQSGTFLWIPDRALNDLLPMQFAIKHRKCLALKTEA